MVVGWRDTGPECSRQTVYAGTYLVVDGRITHGHLDVVEQSGSGPTASCDPAYPDFCIPPPPPDLDCPDVGARDFTVLPLDPAGNLVGGDDHRAQARQVLDNLLVALHEAGAGPEAVVKTTVYVVGDQAALAAVWEAVRESPIGAAQPASTLLGVERLGYRGQLVEVEAVAVLA